MSFEAVLHSVSYAGAWQGQARLGLEEFLEKAAALGYPAVMLMAKRPHLSVLDYPTDASRRLKDRLDALGLRCAVIAGYNNFSADLEHAEVPHREFQIQHIGELARLARDLGAPVVRVFTAYEHPSLSYSGAFNLIVDCLREASRQAAGYGVTLGVQNHHDNGAHWMTLRDILEAVDHPNCLACFDAWAPGLQGDDLATAAHAMAPWTVHTTAADYQRRPRFRYQPGLINYEAQTPWVQAVPMGEGFLDYRGFLAALAAGGYTGGVAYEMCSPLLGGGAIENLDRYARGFLDYLATVPAPRR